MCNIDSCCAFASYLIAFLRRKQDYASASMWLPLVPPALNWAALYIRLLASKVSSNVTHTCESTKHFFLELYEESCMQERREHHTLSRHVLDSGGRPTIASTHVNLKELTLNLSIQRNQHSTSRIRRFGAAEDL